MSHIAAATTPAVASDGTQIDRTDPLSLQAGAMTDIPPPPSGEGNTPPPSPPQHDPEPGPIIRFVTERAAFKRFDRLLAARGDRNRDDAVGLMITPETLVFDFSSPAVACTIRVPYAQDGAPLKTASIEVRASLLAHLAQQLRPDPGSTVKRYFEGSVVWTVDIERRDVTVQVETADLCFSMIDPVPKRATFPDPSCAPVVCEPGRIRSALRAVAPAASADYKKELKLCQVEIEDGRATAVRPQLFAQYAHTALDGLHLRIAKRDVGPVTALLALTNPAEVSVRADDDGVVIEDGQLRIGFHPLSEPLPITRAITTAARTHAFECDKTEFLNVLRRAGTVAGPGGARALQISFSLVVHDGKVHLRAVTEWRPNTCEHSAIPIRMALEEEAVVRGAIEGMPTNGSTRAPITTAEIVQSDSSTGSGEVKPEFGAPVRIELGHYRLANLVSVVTDMTAPVLAFGFVRDRALFVNGTTDEIDALFAFESEAQDQANGLSTRRR